MEILRYPDPRLIAKNAAIGSWTPEVASRVEEMFQSMDKAHGVGLAAPQIGWNVKLFIMAIENKVLGETETTIVFDPRIELLGDEVLMAEGCLSFPQIYGQVMRKTRVRLIGNTPIGTIDQVMTGLPAQAVQH